MAPAVPMSRLRSRGDSGPGRNVRSREPTAAPVTSASHSAAAASTAARCCGRRPGVVAVGPDLDDPERPAGQHRQAQRRAEDLPAPLALRAVERHQPRRRRRLRRGLGLGRGHLRELLGDGDAPGGGAGGVRPPCPPCAVQRRDDLTSHAAEAGCPSMDASPASVRPVPGPGGSVQFTGSAREHGPSPWPRSCRLARQHTDFHRPRGGGFREGPGSGTVVPWFEIMRLLRETAT